MMENTAEKARSPGANSKIQLVHKFTTLLKNLEGNLEVLLFNL
jgi:hypothetical protein